MMCSSRLAFIPVLLLLASTGCSVFEPVGGFVSQSYRNTVAYFNSIYNARRLFADAEKEIQASQRQQAQAAQTTPPTSQLVIPQGARQKLTSVIDKCSGVLAFNQKSDYVQDALLLIAKSDYYLSEFVRAERKCSELLTQFPQSDYRAEAQLWLGMSLMEQNRAEAAKVVLLESLAEAERNGDEDVQVFVLEKLMKLSHREKNISEALAYATRLRTIASDEDLAAASLLAEGQLRLEEARPAEAVISLQNIPGLTDDPIILYQSSMLLVRAHEESGHSEDALRLLDGMREDFRYKDKLGFIRLERARVLRKSSRLPEAVDEYRYVDTTFIRTEAGTTAAYELGDLFESEFADFLSARRQYERASSLPGISASDARKKVAVFSRYFVLQDRLVAVDTLVKAALNAPPDSMAPMKNQIIADSLAGVRAGIMQEVGEWYLIDLQDRDSAATWLLRSQKLGKSHPAGARGLFILADLASSDTTGRLATSSVYYRELIDVYPSSPFSSEARERIGMPQPKKEISFADTLYSAGERAFDVGRFSTAASLFDSVLTAYPRSPLAGKSAYAAGWVYEYRLNLPDSALSRYRVVVDRFAATPFAESAKRRLDALPKPAAKDTSTTMLPVPDTADDKATSTVKAKEVKTPVPAKKPAALPKEIIE